MKIEFGDLYKFIVSLGVILITLSVTAPWLFLREPFDLFKTEQEIKALTSVAQDIIQKRQSLISYIFTFIPLFSSIGLIVGAVFIFIGLKKWQKNQVYLDKQTRLDAELKENALRDSTKDEIDEKEREEISESQIIEGTQMSNSQKQAFRTSYSQIEKIVFDRMFGIYKNKYRVSQNKRVSGVELDILLEGKSFLAKDYIVEVKYIRKGFNFGWLNETFLRNLHAQNLYAKVTDKAANTLLLIVMATGAYNESKYKNLIERLSSNELARKGKDIVRILTEEELSTISDTDLQEKLGINA